ncbi:MAG: MscL family protein, partial [Gemmatimonadota bacterium]
SPGPYATLEQAREAGAVPLAYGAFVNNVVTFFLVAFAVFLIVKTFIRNASRRFLSRPRVARIAPWSSRQRPDAIGCLSAVGSLCRISADSSNSR